MKKVIAIMLMSLFVGASVELSNRVQTNDPIAGKVGVNRTGKRVAVRAAVNKNRKKIFAARAAVNRGAPKRSVDTTV